MDTLKKVSENLKKCRYDIELFQSCHDVKHRLSELVNGKSVGYGSSMTLEEIDVINNLYKFAKNVFPHHPGDADANERNALTADFYLTSANALSMDGHIVNIDGTGNRVAATCFGPKKVIYIIGKNKITETLSEALDRAKTAAVKLARFFNRNTPCVSTGKCEECFSPESVCSITTIHRKKPYGSDISIFLVDESLGL